MSSNDQKHKFNMKDSNAEAKKKSLKLLKDVFQSPGQLDKIEHHKRTVIRNKPSVEGFFRLSFGSEPCIQSEKTLERCLKEAQEIGQSLKHAINTFPKVEVLYGGLNELREENMRHSQYVTARENLKHIFTVPESVERTEKWINEGKLLHTHQCLRDLENSRDALLYELHRLPNQSTFDKNMLSACFKDVEVLSVKLEKQLKLILSRTLNTVRKEPTVIVTALRIVEREEKLDEEAQLHKEKTSFSRPGRPKEWRKMAFEVFEKAVATRIEGTQVDERENNKMWLVTYLELTRQLILEDLRVVKTLCVPCFPEKYNIVDAYVRMYHNCLRRHLQEIIQNGLEGNEYVSILSWTLNTYKSEELMGHPDLARSTQNLEPLLPDGVLETLQQKYLKNIEKDYTEWLGNAISQEKLEWMSTNDPAIETTRATVPVVIYQMIHQVLSVTQTISQDITNKAFIVSIEQVLKYGEQYKEAIIEYRNKLLEDRNQVMHFTYHMITIVNNCKEIIDIGEQLKKFYWKPNHNQQISAIKTFPVYFDELRKESSKYLLDEVFMDVSKHFDDLFTPRWIGNNIPVDTICATFDDYFQDYNRLLETNLEEVISEAKMSVAKRYITAMLSKKMAFKTFDECQKAAAQIVKELDQFKRVFDAIAHQIRDEDENLETITTLTEVLKAQDDMISFDLHNIVEKYPNITEDHLLRLLFLRGDLPKSDLKEKVVFAMKSAKPKIGDGKNVFDDLKFTTLLGKLNL
ncbi:exocyst complex component 3 [Onthophagus taurus]|uniref:exocyst complex component 3 n=1 Tax=Onthophagus taurus TaxID=166361 RepID=UPI000C20CB64|nr:exocyst complex component 3 [Onthophagus taurus]